MFLNAPDAQFRRDVSLLGHHIWQGACGPRPALFRFRSVPELSKRKISGYLDEAKLGETE